MNQALYRYLALAIILVLTLAACDLQAPVQNAPPTSTPTLVAVSEESTPTQAPTAVPPPEPTPTYKPEPTATPASASTVSPLRAHFIDVGQGDATLLEGEGVAILIDAGRHTGDEVVPYLQSVGIEELDLLIGTHPHADHIGQFPRVLDALPVTEVWLSGDPHTTLTFERALVPSKLQMRAITNPRLARLIP